MKTQVIIGTLLLSASLITAQTNSKPTTVRVKKIENINGVEKIIDSTYTVNGSVNINSLEEFTKVENIPGADGKEKKVIIVTDEVKGNDLDVKTLTKEDLSDEQIQRALKEAGVDLKDCKTDKITVVNVDEKTTDEKGEKKTTRVVIIKKIRITDATEEDTKMLGKQTGAIDNKLAVDQMNFYPNPNNGKFNLNFSIKDKGNTEVSILNVEGKSIYNEELKDFSGTYNKEIDISSNPKGVYFVKIKQGTHAQLKKIVLE